MKKLILGIMSVVVLMGLATTNVKAANLNANKTEVNKGEEITVSVDLERETRNIDVRLTYDASKFEYVKGSASSSLGTLTVNDANEGRIIVSASNPTQSTRSISFRFIAKENTDSAIFQASGLVTEEGEALSNDSISVKVVEAQEEPTQPTEPSEEPEQPSEEQPTAGEETTENNNEVVSTEEIVDENGNVITTLPQTGVPYVAFAIAGVIMVAVIVAIRKLKK